MTKSIWCQLGARVSLGKGACYRADFPGVTGRVYFRRPEGGAGTEQKEKSLGVLIHRDLEKLSRCNPKAHCLHRNFLNLFIFIKE